MKITQVNHFLETTGCLELLFLSMHTPTCASLDYPPLRVLVLSTTHQAPLRN